MINFFKNLLNCSIGYGEESLAPNYGFIVPHTRENQGAKTWDGKYSEYIYYSLMISDLNFPFTTRDAKGVTGAAKNLASRYCNVSIEPHFNSFNGKAHGAEILILAGDEVSRMYAERFLEMFEDMYMNRRIRGVKEISPGGRGYKNLKQARKYMQASVLPELFFGDNPNDFLDVERQVRFWGYALKSDV